jgi:hypothetical protein
MISLATIDYFSQEGIPYLALGFFYFWLLQPFATLAHETGHVLCALFFSRGRILVRVGENKEIGFKVNFKMGRRLFCSIGLNNPLSGVTIFRQQKVIDRSLILIGGPFSSFIISGLTGFLLFSNSFSAAIEIPLAVWFCLNLLSFLRSALPVRLKPTISCPDGVPSDGLQILGLLCGGKSGN